MTDDSFHHTYLSYGYQLHRQPVSYTTMRLIPNLGSKQSISSMWIIFTNDAFYNPSKSALEKIVAITLRNRTSWIFITAPPPLLLHIYHFLPNNLLLGFENSATEAKLLIPEHIVYLSDIFEFHQRGFIYSPPNSNYVGFKSGFR